MEQPQEQLSLSTIVSRYLADLSPDNRGIAAQELNKFLRWVGGDRPISDLRPHDVGSYGETIDPTTPDLPKKLEALRGFLVHLRDKRLSPTNLSTHLRVKKAPGQSGRAIRPAAPGITLTREGHAQLKQELEDLIKMRPAIAEELRLAAADKDFRENAPLDAARDKQGQVEARIRELQEVLKSAVIADERATDDRKVDIGTTALLKDLIFDEELRFTLVGER
jgi:transcription elongation factor GreA